MKKNLIKSPIARQILSLSLPLALSSALHPLFSFVECTLAVHLLTAGTLSQTAQYGIYAGAAASLLSLPLVLATSVCTALLPRMATDYSNARAEESFTLTLAVLLPFCLYYLAFADELSAFLYAGLPQAERRILSQLLRIGTAATVLTALSNTAIANLVALKKNARCALFMLIGLSVRLFALLLLLKPCGVYALPVAEILGTAVSATLNFIYLHKLSGYVFKPSCGAAVAFSAAVCLLLMQAVRLLHLSTFFSLASSATVFFTLYGICFLLPFLKKQKSTDR